MLLLHQIETEKQQTEKHVDALTSLNIFNKRDELKEIEGIFPKNLLNNLIIYKLQDMIKL